MMIFVQLSVLALRPLLGVAANSLGFGFAEEATTAATTAIGEWLGKRFVDHSKPLTKALDHANRRAWGTLEMALAGDGLFSRLGRIFKRADQKALADEVRRFLNESAPAIAGTEGNDFRRACLDELRAARSAELLNGDAVDLAALAKIASPLSRFSKPQELLAADLAALSQISASLPHEYTNLRRLLTLRPSSDSAPLLAEAARYFFRRQVETEEELFRGLSFSLAQETASVNTRGFAMVDTALNQWGNELRQAMDDLLGRVDEIHENVSEVCLLRNVGKLLERRWLIAGNLVEQTVTEK